MARCKVMVPTAEFGVRWQCLFDLDERVPVYYGDIQ